MRKSVRKFTGILLAVIMFVTAVFPQQGMAAENNALEREAAEKVKAHSEGEAEKEKAFLSEDAVTEELSRKRDSSEQDQIPETEQLPEAQGGGLENPAGHELPFTEEAEGRTFMLPGGSEDILPQADSYDIYPPVIENFEFEENGDALTVNDILHFTVSAYDADGEIQSIVVSVSCSDAQGSGASVTLEKSGEGNLYAGTISCSSLKGRNFYISGIYAEDKANNYVNWKTWDENGQYKYQFTLDAEVNIDENVLVSNFRMQANPANEDGKLRAGDMVTYTADVTCKEETIRNIVLYLYANTDGYYGSESISAVYSAETQTLTGTYTVTEETYPAEWRLEQIYVYTESDKCYYFYPNQTETDANLSFTVVQADFDTEKPVIEDISIDKNGEILRAGDVVTLTVKVKEEHPSENASAWFYPQVENVSASAYVNLEFHASAGAYTGSITVTEDMYPCEWALTNVSVSDKVGHFTYIHDFQSDSRKRRAQSFLKGTGSVFSSADGRSFCSLDLWLAWIGSRRGYAITL